MPKTTKLDRRVTAKQPGRPREDDEAAILDYFARALNGGQSVTQAASNGIVLYKPCGLQKTQVAVRRVCATTLERRYRQIRKDLLDFDVGGLARSLPPKDARKIAEQAWANAQTQRGPASLLLNGVLPLRTPKAGRPRMKKSEAR